jgi:hypothetical protein
MIDTTGLRRVANNNFNLSLILVLKHRGYRMPGRGHLEQVSEYILLPGKGGRETKALLHYCACCMNKLSIRWTGKGIQNVIGLCQ